MIAFLIYDTATGVILQASTSSWSELEVQAEWELPEGAAILVVPVLPTGPFDHFRVANGEVVERASIAPTISADVIAANGIAESIIAGLPNPCRVTFRGAVDAGPADLTGGAFTLTSTQPGVITIRVTADPTHKPWEGVIHAV